MGHRELNVIRPGSISLVAAFESLIQSIKSSHNSAATMANIAKTSFEVSIEGNIVLGGQSESEQIVVKGQDAFPRPPGSYLIEDEE